jgi:hypothetical protein
MFSGGVSRRTCAVGLLVPRRTVRPLPRRAAADAGMVFWGFSARVREPAPRPARAHGRAARARRRRLQELGAYRMVEYGDVEYPGCLGVERQHHEL